jgi:YD repeat-containing protein
VTYDQVTGHTQTKTTDYSYTIDATNNSALVHAITTTDSWGNTYTKTVYHPNDAGIPSLTTADQSVISSYLLPGHNLNVVIHENENRNGVTHDLHNSYVTEAISGGTEVFLGSASIYTAGALSQQQYYNYDPSHSNLIGTSDQGQKWTSASYGYSYVYPVAQVDNAINDYNTLTTEYYYEGFEQWPTSANIVSGTAHTGNVYYNTNYTIPFTIPNGRSYIIQWWNLVSGAWVFNQQTFTNGMVLTGPVDDIRIFPSDALMTSYTYNPMVGKTSETDPRGKTTKYEYDGIGRLLRVRDQNNNILKQYDYEFQSTIQP